MLSVSVVVVNWNGRPYLQACLDSLVSQDHQNYDIWVVDNDSRDGSAHFVKEHYPNVNLIRSHRNLGFASGCNLAIRQSARDAIALFNNDAVAHPSWLSGLAKQMEADPNVAVTGGPIFYFDRRDVLWFSGARVDGFTGVSWNIGQFERQVLTAEVDSLSGCAMLIRASVLKELGGLDEGYFVYSEDLDICLAATRLGYKIVFVPSAVVWHKVGGSGGIVPGFTYYLKLRSDMRFAFKNLSRWAVPVAPFIQAFLLPLTDSLSQGMGPGAFCKGLKALGWNLSNLRATFAQRSKWSRQAGDPPKPRLRELTKVAGDRFLRRKHFWPSGITGW